MKPYGSVSRYHQARASTPRSMESVAEQLTAPAASSAAYFAGTGLTVLVVAVRRDSMCVTAGHGPDARVRGSVTPIAKLSASLSV
jgi:hypothetical protein